MQKNIVLMVIVLVLVQTIYKDRQKCRLGGIEEIKIWKAIVAKYIQQKLLWITVCYSYCVLLERTKKKKNKEVSNGVANEKIFSVPKKPVVSNFASFIYFFFNQLCGGWGWGGG